MASQPMLRYHGSLLLVVLALQLTLVYAAPAQVTRVKAYFVNHPKCEGVSLVVDRMADSDYGLFDPLPSGAPGQAPVPAPVPGQQPLPVDPPVLMQPEEPALLFKDFVVPSGTSLWAPEDLRPVIERESARYGVDPLLVEAIIRNESGFNPKAVSRAGAQGLMQLMPGTAAQLGVTDPFDVEQNISGGTQYFSWQLQRFGGDVSLALAAYNAGPESVQRWNGIPPYQETIDYVQHIMEDYRAMMFSPAR